MIFTEENGLATFNSKVEDERGLDGNTKPIFYSQGRIAVKRNTDEFKYLLSKYKNRDICRGYVFNLIPILFKIESMLYSKYDNSVDFYYETISEDFSIEPVSQKEEIFE